ncbi:MAG: hypothetical protein R6U63_05690 [Longimicrobiales bacterium]
MTPRRRPSLARHSRALLLLALTAGGGCGGDGDARSATLPPEPWVDRPVSEWPDFALSNDVVFTDTSYSYLANAFTIDTGADTVGATAKHLFMLFERRQGLHSVALGDDFRGWWFRSSRDTARVVTVRRLMNADSTERIGDFSGLKDRDWLVFELGEWADGVHPLKVRHTPLEPGDTMYAVGRSRAERRDRDPALSPLQVFRGFPTYYYVQPLDPDVDPVDTSGSPVIDDGGYLVGLVSGAVGRLGVVAGVGYLRRVLEWHGVPMSAQP